MRSIAVALGRDCGGLRLVYRLAGSLAQLLIPTALSSLPNDRLWAHTCFEAFLAPASGSGYREWNFSPSGQMAEYAFSGYRNRIDADGSANTVGATLIHIEQAADVVRLDARIALPPPSAGELAVGLSAVIEDARGGLSYWALRHPSSEPDFHHRDGFALTLDLDTGMFFI